MRCIFRPPESSSLAREGGAAALPSAKVLTSKIKMYVVLAFVDGEELFNEIAGNYGEPGMGKSILLAGLLFLSCIVNALKVAGQAASSPPTDADLLQVAASLQMYVEELPDMPKINGYSSYNGRLGPANLTIGMFEKKWKFHRDLPATTVFAFGTSSTTATVPGPTILSLQNVPTYVTWENHLPSNHILPWDPTILTAVPKTGGVATVVHLHGGIDEPQSDGNPFAWFTADFNQTGPAWTTPTYTYLNDIQPPGNIFYHDHALGLTRLNILAGLFGGYLVSDPATEGCLNLPSSSFDRLILIFDRSFNKDGSLYMNYTGVNPPVHPQWQPEYFGDAIIVNGKAWPFMNVQVRKYRFRIVNVANARYFRLSLSNGLNFTQIASDYSYLPQPVVLSSILLGPAEGADVIIDFSKSSGEVLLLNDAPYPYPSGNAVDSLNSKVMKFVIQSQNAPVVDRSVVPKSIATYPKPVTTGIARTRYLGLYEYSTNGLVTHLYINGKRFTDPATETPVPGSTEIWKIINLTQDDHPLHLHLAMFQAIERRGLVNTDQLTACMNTTYDPIKCNISSYEQGPLFPIPPSEMTWKNIVKMAPGNMTTAVVKFGYVHKNASYPFDPTAEPGYVYHCHILDHEDNEMMRPLKLVW
ncbi:multicopper oxidase LPR1 homolog 1-like [Nymphaea colorata]|nr:multicopper oxidase LPR1 homolog 1-like [Nymphaea colorata]